MVRPIWLVVFISRFIQLFTKVYIYCTWFFLNSKWFVDVVDPHMHWMLHQVMWHPVTEVQSGWSWDPSKSKRSDHSWRIVWWDIMASGLQECLFYVVLALALKSVKGIFSFERVGRIQRIWKGMKGYYIYIYSDLKCSGPGFGNAQGTPTSHWMLGTRIETTSARTFKWAPQRGLGRWAFRMDQIDRLSIPTGWTLESVSDLLQATGSETHTVMHLYGTWLQVDIMLWTQCSILSPLPPHYWYYWPSQAWVWMRGRCIPRLAPTRLTRYGIYIYIICPSSDNPIPWQGALQSR